VLGEMGSIRVRKRRGGQEDEVEVATWSRADSEVHEIHERQDPLVRTANKCSAKSNFVLLFSFSYHMMGMFSDMCCSLSHRTEGYHGRSNHKEAPLHWWVCCI
jgi:hypothetical protein